MFIVKVVSFHAINVFTRLGFETQTPSSQGIRANHSGCVIHLIMFQLVYDTQRGINMRACVKVSHGHVKQFA